MATAGKTTRKKRDTMPDPLVPEATSAPVQQELQPTGPDQRATQLAVVYGPIEQGLALLREKHGHVLTTKIVVTGDNLDTIKKSHRELVTFRTTLEATRKAEKEESLRYGQKVDAEAKRIQTVADPIEKAYKDALDAYERAEEERKSALLARIKELRETPHALVGATTAKLEEALQAIKDYPLAELQEFREMGAQAQLAAQLAVEKLLEQRREADRAKAAAELARKMGAIRERAANMRQARRAATLSAMVATFEKEAPTAEAFGEQLEEATRVHAEELAGLRTLLKEREDAEARDAENARLKAQLEAMQKAEDERKAREAAAATPAPTPEPTAAPTPAPTEAPAPLEPSDGERFGRATSDRPTETPAPTLPFPSREGDWTPPPGAAPTAAPLPDSETLQSEPWQGEVGIPHSSLLADEGPMDTELIDLVAEHYDDTPLNAIERLRRIHWDSAIAFFKQQQGATQ